MAEAYGLTPCTSGLASESELSCSPKVQFGFVPNHSHHGGKNTGFSSLKNHLFILQGSIFMIASGLIRFFSEAVFLPLVMSLVA